MGDWIALAALITSALTLVLGFVGYVKGGFREMADDRQRAVAELREMASDLRQGQVQHQASDDAQFGRVANQFIGVERSIGEVGAALREALNILAMQTRDRFEQYVHRDSFLRFIDASEKRQERIERKIDRLFVPNPNIQRRDGDAGGNEGGDGR